MFLSVWLLLLSFMFNPWALLFFVVLFCVLFVLIEFVPSWSLKSFQYLLLVLVFFFVRVSSARFQRVFVVDGFCVHFVSYCCYFPFFSIVSRFRWINGKKLTFERLQFCPTFVFFLRGFCTQSLFWTNLRPKFFFLFAVSLFILLACARLFAPKLYLLKRLNGFWIYSLFLMFLVKLWVTIKISLLFLHYKMIYLFLNGLKRGALWRD